MHVSGKRWFGKTQLSLLADTSLLGGGEVLATLDVAGFGSDATAQAAEGSLTIEKRGFFNTTYHISNGEMELAVFTPDWGNSGTLQFADGRTFLWDHTGFLRGEYAWKDNANTVYMRFHSSFGGGKLYVVVESLAADIAELSLLTILGRYLEKMQQRRRAAAAAAVH